MVLLDIFYFLLILLFFPFWMKFLFRKKYRHIVKHRFSPALQTREQKQIWIHAVSLGEVKSVKNLIQRLQLIFHNNIVLSVTTPAGYSFAEKEYKNTDIQVIHSPLDFTFVIKKFIKKINPRILILNELEIWPNWISVTKKKQIPILLINGRMSDLAFKRYKKWRLCIKKFFNLIDMFLIQSEQYLSKFTYFKIPESKIKVCGNIKADEALKLLKHMPPEEQIYQYLKMDINSKKTMVFASTHSSDEDIFFPVLKEISREYTSIIIPRHLSRAGEIQRKLNNFDIQYSIWSQIGQSRLENDILIFDHIGYLFNIYKIADIVFMGGTFEKKIGGHNLYEPASQGKYILGGPFTNNFPDIGKDLINRGVYQVITSEAEFRKILSIIQKLDFNLIDKTARQAVLDKKGSTECILNQIQGLLES
jgi:3-deoxy-D-manno-octulosonic-acid transferase